MNSRDLRGAKQFVESDLLPLTGPRYRNIEAAQSDVRQEIPRTTKSETFNRDANGVRVHADADRAKLPNASFLLARPRVWSAAIHRRLFSLLFYWRRQKIVAHCNSC